MTRILVRQEFSVTLVFLLVLSLIILPELDTILLAQQIGKVDLETNYQEAERLFKTNREERAADELEKLIKTEEFEKTGKSFKQKTYLLLAQCYFVLDKVDQTKQALHKLLEADRDVNLQQELKDEKLLEIAEEVLSTMPVPVKRSPQLFHFKPVAPVEARAGKKQEIEIRTSPDSVPVRFRFDNAAGNLYLQQKDSISAILTYEPDPLEAGKTKTVTVTASTADTVQLQTISFRVKESAKKSKAWIYVLVLVVVAGAGAAAVILEKNKSTTDSNTGNLPDPPKPPQQ